MFWEIVADYYELISLLLTFGTGEPLAFIGWIALSPLLYFVKEKIDDRLGIVRY